MCLSCLNTCSQYSYYYESVKTYIKIGKYKYTEKCLFCSNCSRKVKGLYKREIRQRTCFYCIVVKEDKIGAPLVFCNNCDYIFNWKHVYECKDCMTIYTFKCNYCRECGNKTTKIIKDDSNINNVNDDKNNDRSSVDHQ